MKVLIVRFSSIGDIVLTTPVVRCIAIQTHAEIHYLTKEAFAPILTSNPHINRVFTIKENLKEVMPQLQHEQYDLIIDLHHNLRTKILKSKLKRPSRSFDKINVEKWLKVNLKIDWLPTTHIVDRYLKTTKGINVENDGKGLDYFIPDSDVIEMRKFLNDRNIKNHLCLSVGAAHQTKCLTLEQIIELCNQIDYPIMLLGGKSEIEKAKSIGHQVDTHVVNAVNQLSLNQTAASINFSSLLISHDTGVMHMGAALKKSMITIWGNTIPAFGMYPYFGDAEVWHKPIQIEGLSCRPCSKIGYKKCPKGHFKCIQDISIESIAKLANEKMLQESNNRSDKA